MMDVSGGRPGSGTPRPFLFPERHLDTLPSGARVVSVPLTRLPLVSVVVLMRGAGAAGEADGSDGIAQLTALMLMEGAGALDGAALAERFEDLGSSVSSGADWDASTIAASAQPSRLGEVVRLLRDVLRDPSFPPRELERLKSEHAAERLHVAAEPRALADDAFAWRCYGPGSRYRRPLGGTAATVAAFTPEQVEQYWKLGYSPAQLTVVFAGDVSRDQATEFGAFLADAWPAASATQARAVPAARQGDPRVHIIDKAGAAQCELRIGHVGVPRAHPDYFPLTVMNAILGGLFSSRINLNLRERHGYTYGAHSGFDWRRDAGPFVVSTAVNTPVAGAAVREVLSEIERIRTADVTADELSLATDYLAGVFPLRYETTAAVASALAMHEMYGLPPDHFETYRANVLAVTTDDVRRVSATHLAPNAAQVVAVGPAADLVSQLEGVTEAPAAVFSPQEVELAP